MLSNKKQILTSNTDYVFDENEDLPLPETILGEIRFIWFMIKYIIKNPDERKKEIFNLKRQFTIYIIWLKNK